MATNDVPSGRMQIAYGAGGIANGIFANGLSYFLLIYYNLVIGLPAETVGLALSIALLFDAVSDPVVGYLSDNTRARAGKRHPYIYLSVIPVAVLFWLVWNPPQSLDGTQSFWFLLAVTIGLRLAMTLFDVPHNAMVPEMTGDYNGRTVLAGLKVSASWITGQIMVIAMYMVWLVPTETMPYGILNKAGYQEAGLVGAIGIGAAILLSAVGLRPWQGRMHRISHQATVGVRGFFTQFRAAAGLPSLRAIFLSSAVYALGAGVGAALWSYLMSFYWELSSDQIALILLANLAGALIAGALVKALSRGQNKKSAAILLSILSVVVGVAPYLLRAGGMFPENGTEMLLYVLFAHGVIQVALIVWTTSLMTSMTADLVELGLHQTGYQNEGIITAAITFILKAGTAGGLAVSGLFLALVGFPAKPDQTNLSPEILANLGLNYAWLMVVIYVISIWCLTFYRIDKAQFDSLAQARN